MFRLDREVLGDAKRLHSSTAVAARSTPAIASGSMANRSAPSCVSRGGVVIQVASGVGEVI
jgi:hypothetical protein